MELNVVHPGSRSSLWLSLSPAAHAPRALAPPVSPSTTSFSPIGLHQSLTEAHQQRPFDAMLYTAPPKGKSLRGAWGGHFLHEKGDLPHVLDRFATAQRHLMTWKWRGTCSTPGRGEEKRPRHGTWLGRAADELLTAVRAAKMDRNHQDPSKKHQKSIKKPSKSP